MEDEQEDKNNISFASDTDKKPRSNIETVFNVANTMMGSALLVMPVNFYKAGIISSILIASLMAFVSFWTCNLIVIHSKDEEYDYPLAIRRLLGKTWEIIFNILSFFLLLLVSIIHFILMANILYSICQNLSSDASSWPKFDEISFSHFSMQYVGLILFVVCTFLYLLKDIKHVLYVNDKGIYMILAFSLFVMYLGIYALFNKDIEFIGSGVPNPSKKGLQIVLFDTDLIEIVGIFALAYMIHNTISGMMKNVKDSTNNTRNLFLAYIIVFVKYCVLGVFGAFAVAALFNEKYDSLKGELPHSIMELLSGHNPFLSDVQNYFSIFFLFFVFVQLTTVLPILNFFTRRQFYGLIMKQSVEKIDGWKFHSFNIVFNLICLGFEIPVFPPEKVIQFTGAVGGLVLIYILPVYVHLKCLYFGKGVVSDSSLNANINLLKEVSDEVSSDPNECRTDYTHQTIYSKYLIYPVYSILVALGLGICVYSLVGFFKSFK